MTAKFKVGDKVRCVDNRGTDDALIVGEVYKVESAHRSCTARECNDHSSDSIYLVGKCGWWFASRFELVQEESTINFTVGQEVFLIANTSNCTKRLKSAVVLDAVPKHAMIRVSVGDIDCYVEEDRLFVKE